jgi:thymidylate synthase (FAD)
MQFLRACGEKVGVEMKKRIELYGDSIGSVEYVEHMGSDLSVVNSARVSFGKQKMTMDKRDEKLIRYLIEHKHTSTLEHNVVTFRFCVPLFVRSQHHRHRTWSYNEISRRYTEVDLRFYEPVAFRTQHKSNRQASNPEGLIDPTLDSSFLAGGYEKASEALKMHHTTSMSLYNAMIAGGICREQARGVLPQNMYTEYYGTTNLNNLMKFIELRTHEGAQLEIQSVAKACLEIAAELWPITVGAYKDVRNEN